MYNIQESVGPVTISAFVEIIFDNTDNRFPVKCRHSMIDQQRAHFFVRLEKAKLLYAEALVYHWMNTHLMERRLRK